MEFDLPSYNDRMRPSKLLCIGKNYARHADEMQSAVPDEPLVFLKPPSALVRSGGRVRLPSASREVHHEVELVVVIGEGGWQIKSEEALAHVAGYAVGLDMTARDLQREAKREGHPWSVAKGFDTFAPLGPLVKATTVADPQDLEISVSVNDEVRQQGHTGDMVFAVAELISYCSSIFTLEAGDLLYTGTPEGVGPVEDGDVIEARVADWPALRLTVGRDGLA